MAEGQQSIIIPPPVPGTKEYYFHQRQNRELLPIEKKIGIIRDPDYKYVYRSNDKKSIGISSVLYLLCFFLICLSTSRIILPKPKPPITIELSFGEPESNISNSVDIELSGINNDLITEDIGDIKEEKSLLDIDYPAESRDMQVQQAQNNLITPSKSDENSFDSYLKEISDQTIESVTVPVTSNAADVVQKLSSSIGKAVSINNASTSTSYGSGDNMESRLANAGAKTGEIQISLFWNTCDDIDLHVYYTPGNGLCDNIHWKNRYGRLSKGILDVDMNAQGPHNFKCVENIFWPYGSSPRGMFVVQAHLFRSWSGQKNVPITVRIKIGNDTKILNGVVWNGAAPTMITKFSY